MNDDRRWSELEDATAAMLDSWYRRYVGLDYDPVESESSAEAASQLAEDLVADYRHEAHAWGFLSTIIMFARLTPLDLEIEKLNEEHFTFEDILLDGRPVTPYSRWQYLYQEDDPEKRHELLSRLTRGHPAVDEALDRYRAQKNALAEEWDYTPLDDFLLAERLDLPKLKGLLTELASAMRPSFESHFAENRAAVLRAWGFFRRRRGDLLILAGASSQRPTLFGETGYGRARIGRDGSLWPAWESGNGYIHNCAGAQRR